MAGRPHAGGRGVSGAVRPPVRLDVHAHLAGIGTNGSHCWTSARFRSRYSFRLLQWFLGITPEQLAGSIDADWAAGLARRVRESEVDHAVALGFDGVYDARGELDREKSQMIVPHRWVFEVCEQHRELLPGPSVNPNRRDALDALEECVERGAALIKWLPATHGIDPSHPGHAPFYRRLAESGIPLLVHSGGSENVFAEVDSRLKDLRLLETPLEMGVKVIVAHSGAPVVHAREENQIPLLRKWLRRFPHLWVDNSGMANLSRFPYLPAMARDAEFVERTLHGSDFPVTTNSFFYVRQLGRRRMLSLEREKNLLQRDVAIKRALGFPDEVLTRATNVLPNLERWVRREGRPAAD